MMDYFTNMNYTTNIDDTTNISYNDYGTFGNIGYASIPTHEEKEDTKVRLTKEDEDKVKAESSADKISGKLPFGSAFKLIDLDKRTIDTPYYTKPLSDMKFLDNEVVEFDLGSVNPYEHRKLFYRRTVTFTPNEINCLIGCNGSGKSTIINIIDGIIKENGFAKVSYNNMEDGGTGFLQDNGSIEYATEMFSIKELSEGEQILNASSKYLDLLAMIIKGKVIRDDSFHLFRDQNHIFLLLDAIDSGYSIDNITHLLYNLKAATELSKQLNKNLYIIAAANSFELVRHNRCWDVQRSKEAIYDDYDEYRKRILETRAHILKQWGR